MKKTIYEMISLFKREENIDIYTKLNIGNYKLNSLHSSGEESR